MGQIVGIIAILVVLGLVLLVLKRKLGLPGGSGKVALPYIKEEALLTPAERSFLGVLEQAIDGRYRVMAKVRLADVIKVKGGLEAGDRQRSFNRIQSKHLDFVLCRPSDFAIEGAIELDDSSHARASRQGRDAFVDEALAAADVPLFRFAARRAYNTNEILAVLRGTSTSVPNETESPSRGTGPASAKACPKCGGELLLRTASRGANAGNQFYGCSNYPSCKTTLPVESA